MAYRIPQPPVEPEGTHDLGGSALLALLGCSGLLPLVPALLAGARIEGQSAAGFGIVLGAIILSIRDWRAARTASLPVRPSGPLPSRPHDRRPRHPPRHR